MTLAVSGKIFQREVFYIMKKLPMSAMKLQHGTEKSLKGAD